MVSVMRGTLNEVWRLNSQYIRRLDRNNVPLDEGCEIMHVAS